MKCPKCNAEMKIQIAAKINCEKCKILTEIVSVVTVQCDKCKNISQIPVQSKSFFRVKKDDNQS